MLDKLSRALADAIGHTCDEEIRAVLEELAQLLAGATSASVHRLDLIIRRARSLAQLHSETTQMPESPSSQSPGSNLQAIRQFRMHSATFTAAAAGWVATAIMAWMTNQDAVVAGSFALQCFESARFSARSAALMGASSSTPIAGKAEFQPFSEVNMKISELMDHWPDAFHLLWLLNKGMYEAAAGWRNERDWQLLRHIELLSAEGRPNIPATISAVLHSIQPIEVRLRSLAGEDDLALQWLKVRAAKPSESIPPYYEQYLLRHHLLDFRGKAPDYVRFALEQHF